MKTAGPPIIVMFLLLLSQVCYIHSQTPLGENADRSAVKCFEDSPERRGEEGCTILVRRPMAVPAMGTEYWHIDRLRSLRVTGRCEEGCRPERCCSSGSWRRIPEYEAMRRLDLPAKNAKRREKKKSSSFRVFSRFSRAIIFPVVIGSESAACRRRATLLPRLLFSRARLP